MIPEVFRPPQAAKILGKGTTPQKVRMRMRTGMWPIGDVIPKEKTGNKQDGFDIYRVRFENFFGIKLTEEDFTK